MDLSHILCFVTFCLFHLSVLCNCEEKEHCQGVKQYAYENYLCSMTPYRAVANHTFGKMEYKGCTPAKAWMIVRHGTRNPNAKFIDKMTNRLPEIRDLILENNDAANEYLRHSDLAALKTWNFKLQAKDEKKLTQEGKDEMVNLAERMQSRFPTLFGNTYSNTSFRFKYTKSQRTRLSARYFATGLFGKASAKEVWYPEPQKKDPILRFYKACDKWMKMVKKNASTLNPRKQFDESDIVKTTVRIVNSRLGIKDSHLTFDDVHLMYTACAFETAWKKGYKSPWCAPFTVDDFKVMDYSNELKHYYTDGYGNEVNLKVACPAFKDMFTYFTNKEPMPKSTVYFTHSGALLKFLVHLGLYKDDEMLNVKSFKTRNTERKWRSSKIDAFGSNIAFVLFNCEEGPKMLTLHQEHIIRLPNCPKDEDLCDLSFVAEKYHESIQNCNHDEFCRIKK